MKPTLLKTSFLLTAVGAALALTACSGSPTGQGGQRPSGGSAPSIGSAPSSTVPSPAAPVAATSNPVAPATETVLPAGQTGSRSSVPWELVGAGWRLLQPLDDSGTGPALYLYAPSGGRYLISGQLPAKERLIGWSPDGRRAALTGTNLQQLDLHTGRIVSGFPRGNRIFITYTRPNGNAMVLQDEDKLGQLVRLDPDGRVQQWYPRYVAGAGDVSGWRALYQADGLSFVTGSQRGVLVMSNTGSVERTLPAPAGYQGCHPLSRQGDSAVELCQQVADGARTSLFSQSLSGGQPQPLATGPGKFGMGYYMGWSLSNGDLLLGNAVGCGGGGGYSIQHPDGSIRPLRLPVGVPAPGNILNMDGDLATFLITNRSGCGDRSHATYTLIDYNMVTGATTTLLEQDATLLDYPRS